MIYKIKETYNESASSFSPSLKDTYTIFQFHNDGVNEITITVTPVDPTIDDVVVVVRSEEKFNSGDVINEVPEFGIISVSQSTDGNYRLYLISKE